MNTSPREVETAFTHSGEDQPRRRLELTEALDANRKRRGKLNFDMDQAWEELAGLLAEGRSLPRPLKVTEMADVAGVSRPTVYALLRKAAAD